MFNLIIQFARRIFHVILPALIVISLLCVGIATVGVLAYVSHEANEKKYNARMEVVDNFICGNNGHVKVIAIYGSHAGIAIGVEGSITKERKIMHFENEIPAVGDEWLINRSKEGYLRLLKLSK